MDNIKNNKITDENKCNCNCNCNKNKKEKNSNKNEIQTNLININYAQLQKLGSISY